MSVYIDMKETIKECISLKNGFKRITKPAASLILALCLLITMAFPVMAAGKQTLAGRETGLSQTADEELKGEKIVGEDGKEFYRLDSMTEDQYAAFGLNTKTTPATFTSSPEKELGSCTRLPGLMSLGMYHNGTDRDDAALDVYRSEDIKDNTSSSFNLVKNKKIYYNSKFDSNTKNEAQEQNMEGIDVNGDGFDEIAVLRLSSPMCVELFDPGKYASNGAYTKLGEWSANIKGGAKIPDLEPNETMGYMALTAGDFDGDGCEELAVYVPTEHPTFYLLKYANGSLKALSSFRLEDVSGGKGKRLVYQPDGNKLPDNGYPIVSLSTTSISGKDHIVFNASLPMEYDGYDNRPCMAILDYNGSSLKEVYSDDLTYDNGAYRMRYASATDGDLYGDGEQTLIVGGYKNDDLGSDSSKYNTKQGDLNGSTALVQIIKYNTEENKYERGDLKTASRHSKGLCKMESRKLTNPIAIAAVNFTNSAYAPEFLFLGGKVFKWSDDDALEEKWEMPLGDNNDDDPFIVKAFAMRGITGNYMQEQLFVLAGDTDAGTPDYDYIHTHTIFNANNAGKVDSAGATTDDVQLKDNFVDSWTRVNEDDHGDFCSAAPLQCNGYGATVTCTDKSVGWSDITVEAVLQSVPYWEELTYGEGKGQSSFTISSGKSTGKEHEVVHSNGGFFEVSVVLGFELFNIGGNAGLAGSIEGHKNHGDQDGKEYAMSGSLTINSHAGSDTAVLSATAIGHYLYEVYFPEHIVTAAEHAYMAENYEAYGYNSPADVPATGTLSKAYTTPWINHVNYGQTYSSIEVDKFNDKVRDYYDAGGSKEKLGTIDMSKYNSAVIGDAYSYPADKGHIHYYATQQEYSDLDGKTKETEMIFESKYPVTVNSNADTDAEIEIEFEQTITSGSSTGYDIGGTAGLAGEIDFLVGQVDASAGYSGEREENTIYSDSTITGKSFGVQVCNWEDYTKDGDNSEVSANKYDFNVAPVVLKSLPLSNGDTPFVLTYTVTPLNTGHIAPAIPDNIHVDTVSSSALNVTWKNVGTPERPVSQYEIFQRNVSAKEDTFVSVGTVDATATSFLATNLKPETTYAYKVRSIYDGTYSVFSSEAQGTTLPLDGNGPNFIKHPANAYVKEADANSGTTVTFDALAVPASTDHTVSYQWQKLETSGTEGSVSQWVNLADNTESNPTAFSGTKTDTLSVALNSANAEELNGAIFKVIAVEEGLGTDRSQAVSRSAQLVISENEPIKTYTYLNISNAKDATATVADANGDPVNQGKVTFFLYKRSGDGVIAVDEQAAVEVNNGTASYTFSDKATASESNYGLFAIYNDDAYTYASSCDLVACYNVVHLTADEGASIGFIADEGKPETDLPVALFNQGDEVRFKVGLTSEQYGIDSVEAVTTSGAPIELSVQDGVYSFIMPDESVRVNAKTALLPKVKLVGGDHGKVDFADEKHVGSSEAYFNSDSTVMFTVTPDSGYDGNVAVYTEDGNVSFSYVSGNSTYAFTMPDKDVTVTVAFENSSYNLLKKFKAVARPSEIQIGETSEVKIINIDLTPMIPTPSKNYTVDDMDLYSSDESVATVNADGVITGISGGTATITARLKSNPSIYDNCTVTVVAEKPTEEPTEPTSEEPTEPSSEEPTEPSSEEPTEPSTKPEQGEHGIRNYDELIEFRNKVNSGNYNENAYLENNIIVPEDSEWTQGIGTVDHPYNGTFDGKSFGIVGLNVKNDKYTGLFEAIGANGTVKDLFVLACRSNGSAEYAGGIAAVNEGTIDHCTSGINLTEKTTVTINGKKITPAEYNSYVKGTYSGGITAVNKGVITGTRSCAVVDGDYCGGVAAVNEGKIYGSANNGSVGSTYLSCKQSGGITGENKGEIASSYNAGKPFCGDSTAVGMIAGINSSDKIKNVFYSDFNKIQPVGSSSGVPLRSTDGYVKNSEMIEPAFVTKLNSVTDSSVTWVQTNYNSTYLNQKFPIIQSRNLKNRTIMFGVNFALSGLMNEKLKPTIRRLASDSDEYKSFEKIGDIISAFRATFTDTDDNYIPFELWSAGGFKLSVPVSSKSVCLAAYNSDGDIVTIAPDSVENGVAVFTVADLNSFAVVEEKSPALSAKTAKLSAGKTKTLKVTDGEVKSWSTSDKTVATVKNGKVTALSKGKATVTAKLKTGEKLSCKITVTSDPSIRINGKKFKPSRIYSVKVKNKLTVTITGKASSVKNVYGSSNKRIAKITSKKTAKKVYIKGLKKGSAKITVKVNGVSFKIKVKVA